MLKKYTNEIPSFMRYFQEADGDDKVSVTVAPRENRGTDYSDDSTNVSVAPRQNRGTDYSADDNDGGGDDAPTEADTETNDTPPADDSGSNDGPSTDDEGTDYSADDEGGGDAGGGDDGAADEGGDGGDEGGEDGPDTGDGGTDYSADDGGGDGGDNEGNDEGASDGGESEGSDEDTSEKLKKYHMYTRFVNLYNALNTMIEKCRDAVKPDPTQNAVIKTVTNNLTDIYDNMFDFMTIKYKSATYVQILFYYETVVSVIKLNFELLRNNRINLKQ